MTVNSSAYDMPGIVLSVFIFYLSFLKMPLRNGLCCDSDLAGEKTQAQKGYVTAEGLPRP